MDTQSLFELIWIEPRPPKLKLIKYAHALLNSKHSSQDAGTGFNACWRVKSWVGMGTRLLLITFMVTCGGGPSSIEPLWLQWRNGE